MTEFLFYHLQRAPVEMVLPKLLEKTLERGLRALVLSTVAERLAVLDNHLWTYARTSFLPHGLVGGVYDARQPVLLSTEADHSAGVPNGARILFLIDGADPDCKFSFDRCVDLFDGGSDEAVAAARGRWKTLRERQDSPMTYWQQDEGGRWVKKAEVMPGG